MLADWIRKTGKSFKTLSGFFKEMTGDQIKKYFEFFSKSILILFSFLFFYNFFINGIFEKPSLNVNHFVSGAGGIIMLSCFFLGGLSVLILIVRSFFPQKFPHRMIKWSAALLIPFALNYSVFHMQRFSPNYSEAIFNSIADAYQKHEQITKGEVLKKLGEPLVKGKQPIIKIHENQEGWLYSYMPSCGFGWNKRVLYFNEAGYLCDINRMDEP